MAIAPIKEANPADIPQQLRQMADRIEAGEYGEVATVIGIVDRGAGVDIFGWGLIDGLRCIGLMSIGLAKVNNMTLD